MGQAATSKLVMDEVERHPHLLRVRFLFGKRTRSFDVRRLLGFKISLMAPKRKRDGANTFARLDAFSRGMIWGLRLAKCTREEICKHVTKKDGTAPSARAVDFVIAHKTAHPEWRGQDTQVGGRPEALAEKQTTSLWTWYSGSDAAPKSQSLIASSASSFFAR